VVGSWHDVAGSNAARAGAPVITQAAVAVGVVALSSTVRHAAGASAPWSLIAAVMFVVAGGVGDVTTWYRSQLPWSRPDNLARALVALAFGGGVALAVAALTKLRLGASPDRLHGCGPSGARLAGNRET
jgi:hypothetical protein